MRVRILSTGGNVGTNGANFSTGLKHIGAGGTHEESPYEGVPMGQDEEGTPNLVEENEVIYNDYVFSNRLKINKIYKPQKGKEYQQWEKVLRKYAGKSYAEAAKQAEKDTGVDERPNDTIARKGFDSIMEILSQAQEWQRDIEKQDEQSQYLKTISPEEYAKLKEEKDMQAQQQAQMQEQQAQQQAQQQQMPPEEQQAQMQQQTMQDPNVQAQMQQGMPQEQPQEMPQGFAEGGDMQQEQLTAPQEGTSAEENPEGAQAMEEAPHAEESLFNAGTPAEEMSTSELNETINEIIQYARDNKDKQLLKDARAAKRGSREAKEAFVDDAREDIQMALSEQEAAQQEQQQAAQEEQANIEEQQAAAMQAAQADAGAELNAQDQVDPQQMAAMMSGQQFADGGDLNNSQGGRYSNGVKTYGGDPYPSLAEYNALNPWEKIALQEKYQMTPEQLEKAISEQRWYDEVRLAEEPTLGDLYGYALGEDNKLTRGSAFGLGNTKVVNKGTRYSKSDNVSKELAKAIHENTDYKANTAAYIRDLQEAAKDADTFKKMLQSRGVQWAIKTDELRGKNHAASLLTYDAEGNPTGIKSSWSPKGQDYDHNAGKTYNNVKDYVEALRSKDPGVAHNDLDMGTRYIATDTNGTPLRDQNGNPIYLNGDQVRGGAQYSILNDDNPTINGRWQDYYVTTRNNPAQDTPQEKAETPAKETTTETNVEEEDEFPKRGVWGDVAKVAAQAGAAIHNIVTPPDYTHANAIESAANRPVRYVGFNPVGIRQAYNPADPFFLSHQGMAQNRATAQDLINVGNGNQGAIAGNLIMNNYQSQLNQGQNYYQAHQQNTAQQLAANQFNAQQEQFNSTGLFNAGRANQDAYNNMQKQRYDAAVRASAMRQSIDDAKAKAVSQGLSGVINGIGTIFDNDYNNQLLAWKLRHNYNPISRLAGDYTATTTKGNTTSPAQTTTAESTGETASKAKGGKLKRKRNRGFNL